MPRAFRLIVPLLLLVIAMVVPSGALAAAVTPTTTTVTVDHASVPAGTGTAAFTIAVAPDSGPGPVTGTGFWTLTGPGGPLATNSFTGGGPLTVTLTGLGAGTYTLTAAFSGDATFGPSSGSASTDFVVIATTTTVTVNNATAVAGLGSASFTVAVNAASNGPATGTGTWTLTGPSGVLATNTFSAGSAINISLSGLAAGVYTLSATYAGNATFGPSTGSASTTFVIVPTTTTVTVDHASLPAGSGSATFTVAVGAASNGPATGTGTWTLTGPSGPIATNTFSAGSPINVSLSGLDAGTYTLAATYPGNTTFGASSGSASMTFTLNPTTTTVTVDHASVPAGTGLVSFTIDTSGSSLPGPMTGTGTWSFSGPSGVIATNSYAPGTPFSVSVSGMPAGTYTLDATYPGNGIFGPSSGSASTMFVAGTDSVSLTSSANPSVTGQNATFTAVVTGSGPMPTGTVTFLDGSTVLGTGALDGTGTATFSTSVLGAGSHSITAAYGGSSTYGAATSAALTQVVNAPQPPVTTASLTPPANGAGWNKTPVTVALTSTPASGGAPVAATYYAVDDPTCTSAALGTCSTYTAPFTVAADGVHTVTFFAVDTLGDFEAIQSVLVRIDQVAPVTTATLGSAPNGAGWFKTPVTVTFSATDALSGIDRIEFSLDGGAWTTVAGTTTVSTDGVHLLSYRSVDRAGNVESSRSLTLKIDAAAPVLTVTPTAGELPHFLPLITLQGTASFRTTSGVKVGSTAVSCFDTKGLHLKLTSTDGGSGLSSLTYSATGALPIPSKTVTGSTATISVTANGMTTVVAMAMDGAGNTSPSQRWAVLDRRDDIPVSCAMPLGSLSIPGHGLVLVKGRVAFWHGWSGPVEFTLRY